jgi:hypothetical protein
MDFSTLTTIVADLMSEDGENPEYDRACVEILMHCAPTCPGGPAGGLSREEATKTLQAART